jgi:hypothetical protein
VLFAGSGSQNNKKRKNEKKGKSLCAMLTKPLLLFKVLQILL